MWQNKMTDNLLLSSLREGFTEVVPLENLIYSNGMGQIYTLRPGQVDSQFIVMDISKSHAGRRSFFIFHSTADCSSRAN